MSDEAKYKQWFQQVDQDGSGALSYSELYDFLTERRGYTKEHVEMIFDVADTNEDGIITLNEYLALMKAHPEMHHKESVLRSLCRAFDKNGDGLIDSAEMKTVFHELGKEMSDEDIQRIMKMTDTSGDSKIDYNELCMKVFGQKCD